eukprot:s1139_g18.t1
MALQTLKLFLTPAQSTAWKHSQQQNSNSNRCNKNNDGKINSQHRTRTSGRAYKPLFGKSPSAAGQTAAPHVSRQSRPGCSRRALNQGSLPCAATRPASDRGVVPRPHR